MAKCRARENRVDEAIKYVRRAIAAAPNEAEPHCMLGHLLLGRDGKLKRAFNHFARAIAIRPDFVKAHVGIGLAWNRLGDPGQAERAFTTAHDLAPEDPFPLYYLGVLAAEQRRVNTAVELFQKTLIVDPMFKRASSALAQIAAQRPRASTK